TSISTWVCEKPRPSRPTSAPPSTRWPRRTRWSRDLRASAARSRCPQRNSELLFEHNLFGKSVPTFPDYALDPRSTARQTDHGRDDEQHDRDEEDRLGDFDGDARDAAETQNAGDQGDDQEGDDPAQHDKLRNLDSRADATCADAFDEIIVPGNKGSGHFKAARKRKISPGKEQIAAVSRAA